MKNFALYILMFLGASCASTVRSTRSTPPRDDVPMMVDVPVDATTDAQLTDVAPDQGLTLDSGMLADASDGATDVIDAPSDTGPVYDLRISLSSTPRSTTVVKRTLDIPTVGMAFTTSRRRVLVQDVPLMGVGNTTGTFTPTGFGQVAVACAAFDGATRISPSIIPEVSDGLMLLRGINLLIEAGTTRSIVVKCIADSVIARREVGDQMAVGIGVTDQIVARLDDGTRPLIEIDPALREQVTGPSRRVVITVIDHGNLSIRPDAHPQSTILVPGGAPWQLMAQYRASATYEGALIDRLNERLIGDSASYDMIAVAVGGVVRASAVPPSGIDRGCDVDLSMSPIVVLRDEPVVFQLWGHLNPVVAPSSVTTRTDVALSGARVGLGINAGLRTGEWDDARYVSSLAVRATGTSSGERLFVAADRPLMGNEHIVRRTKITVTTDTVSIPHEIDPMSRRQPLMRSHMMADTAAPAALKAMGYTLRLNRVPGSGLRVTNPHLERDGRELPSTTYQIIRLSDGANLTGDIIDADMTEFQIVFTDEQRIEPLASTVYTLTGEIQNALVGDSVVTAFLNPVGISTVTGRLTSDNFLVPHGGGGTAGLHIDLGTGPYPMPIDPLRFARDVFVWSDVSDVPHERVSLDWIGGYLLRDLTVSTVLTRNPMP